MCGRAASDRPGEFRDPALEPALSVLVDSLEREADLHPLGRFLMRAHLRGLLETRLRLAEVWSRQAEAVAASLIDRPVFITGMPGAARRSCTSCWLKIGRSRAAGLGSDVSRAGPPGRAQRACSAGPEGRGLLVVVPPVGAEGRFGSPLACLDAA